MTMYTYLFVLLLLYACACACVYAYFLFYFSFQFVARSAGGVGYVTHSNDQTDRGTGRQQHLFCILPTCDYS